MMQQPLGKLAQEIATLLSTQQEKIVFAESCTAGLISATLSRVPGISNVHCGSAVVYRLDTKTQWLGVPKEMLVDPGPVSVQVARAMAEGVLAHTPEATIAASITGHLGPNAPIIQDGLVFVGIAIRGESSQVIEYRIPKFAVVSEFIFPGESEREQRQWVAVEFMLTQVANALRNRSAND